MHLLKFRYEGGERWPHSYTNPPGLKRETACPTGVSISSHSCLRGLQAITALCIQIRLGVAKENCLPPDTLSSGIMLFDQWYLHMDKFALFSYWSKSLRLWIWQSFLRCHTEGATKEKIYKLDFIKIKNTCASNVHKALSIKEMRINTTVTPVHTHFRWLQTVTSVEQTVEKWNPYNSAVRK